MVLSVAADHHNEVLINGLLKICQRIWSARFLSFSSTEPKLIPIFGLFSGFVLLGSLYSYFIMPYWGFPHLSYEKLRSNLGNRLRYAKLFLFNCSSCQLRISLKLRNPASKVRGWYDSIKMQFNMLYLIQRLENPIWWHTHTHIPKWPCFLVIVWESVQYKGRTFTVSSLLALEMALSCIPSIHIRNMAHKDTHYRSKTSHKCSDRIIPHSDCHCHTEGHCAVVNSSLINFHMVPLVTVTVCR